MEAKDFFNVNGVKTRLELNLDYGINLSINGYSRTVTCLNHYVRRLRPRLNNNGSKRSFPEEFLLLKRPSKKLRLSFYKKKKGDFDPAKSKTVIKFLELTNLNYPGMEKITRNVSAWNNHGISNRIKTFMFKFYNNILGLNIRLSHFVQGQLRGCTFCTGTVIPVPDESFIHLFLECPTTFEWHNSFLAKYIPAGSWLNAEQRGELFFFGRLPGAEKNNLFLQLSILILQYCIWEEKLRKKKPSFSTLENNYCEHILSLTQLNGKIRKSAELITFPLCRLAGINRATAQQQPAWIPAPLIPRRLPRQP